MKLFGILIVLLGILIIIYPELIAYIIGGFLIFIGFNILIWITMIERRTKNFKKEFDVFGYKVYKRK